MDDDSAYKITVYRKLVGGLLFLIDLTPSPNDDLWVGLVRHRPYQLHSTQFCHLEFFKWF